jgi:hypothetical protein
MNLLTPMALFTITELTNTTPTQGGTPPQGGGGMPTTQITLVAYIP